MWNGWGTGGRLSGRGWRAGRVRRWARRVGVGLGAGLVALAGVGAIVQVRGDASSARRYPAPGRLIEVNGHLMHLWCTGTGSPTVVLISGLGGWSMDWAEVQPAVSRSTRVCSYDRPGFGWSAPHASSLTPSRIVADLHDLLRAGNFPGPYILVGQSVGGIYARSFAVAHPDEVLGMVFVDSAHEEQFSRYPNAAAQNKAGLRLLRFARYLAPLGLGRLIHQPVAVKGLSPKLQAEASAIGYQTRSYFAFYDEASRFLAASLTSLRLPSRPFDLPIVVVTSGEHLAQTSDGPQWGELQRELVALSPCGRQVVAAHAGHDVEADSPEVVIKAILDVLASVRAGPGCPL